MRVQQDTGARGSLQWIQRLVSSNPHLLDDAIRAGGGLLSDETIHWVSPLADDGWAEYRDGDFLDRLGQSALRPALASY